MTRTPQTLASFVQEAACSCSLVHDPSSFRFLRKAADAAIRVRGPLPAFGLFRLLRRIAPYTMVPPAGVAFAAQQAVRAGERGGVIVECGTWMGGTSFAMALAQRAAFGQVRAPVWMFDSFEGLPRPDDRDGEAAFRLMDSTSRPLAASLEAVRSLRAAFGLAEAEAPIVPGWFSDTLPATVEALHGAGGVALLRLDGDWYESTRTAVRVLLPLVNEGGVVIIDDYYAWEGCARAVHEVLASDPGRAPAPHRARGGRGMVRQGCAMSGWPSKPGRSCARSRCLARGWKPAVCPVGLGLPRLRPHFGLREGRIAPLARTMLRGDACQAGPTGGMAIDYAGSRRSASRSANGVERRDGAWVRPGHHSRRRRAWPRGGGHPRPPRLEDRWLP